MPDSISNPDRGGIKSPILHLALSHDSAGKKTVATGADRLYFTVGHYLMSDENSACWIPIRRNILSDGDAKACLCTTVIES